MVQVEACHADESGCFARCSVTILFGQLVVSGY